MNSGHSITDVLDSELGSQRYMKDWPALGLEYIGFCPICKNSERTILHKDLVDNVFFCAPGKWTLWRCISCESAYLDPRPSREFIHLAYENYYTHLENTPKQEYSSLSIFRKMRRQLVNGYTKTKFGTKDSPANAFGFFVAFLIPSMKKKLDRQYRHLPKLPNDGGVLLDVGCGDGSFLSLARACGWNVVGLDPDPKAVENAVKQGLTVHEGGIEYFSNESHLFDVITLNHVIEHVYDPVRVLEACRTLLKPGGQLWLETPNIDSYGHAHFQRNWRGLEMPRHLVLFNRRSLSQAVINAGFKKPRDCTSPSPCAVMYQASFAMEQGRSPYENQSLSIALSLRAKIAEFVETFMLSRREFMTISVHKPK